VTIRELHEAPGSHNVGNGQTAPVTVTRKGLESDSATEANREATILLSARISAGAGVEVADMMWSPASAPRCAGGHPAYDLLLDLDAPPNSALAPDAQVHWERPLMVSGERVLSGRFDEDRPLLRQPSVLDVRLFQHDGQQAHETCVRVPATGPAIRYRPEKTWSLGGRISARRSLAFTDSSTFAVGLSIGRWLGPVRLGLEGFAGGTLEEKPDKNGDTGTALCALGPGPDCDGVKLGGFALEASGIGWRWERWALGWSLGYEAIFAGLNHLSGDPVAPPGVDPVDHPVVHRTAAAGGPRVALQMLHVPADVAGTLPFAPTSAWGYEVFLAWGQTWTGRADGAPLALGVGLLGF
jgi:hypothetical protein